MSVISLPTPPPVSSTVKTGTSIVPGVYDMRATDADLGYTQGSEGNPPSPQVAVLMEFVDGPYKGQSITWYGFFTEKTKTGTIRALRLLGLVGDDVSDLSTVRGQAPCTVQVEPDLHGVAQAKIRFVGGGAIAMKNTMSPEQKKAFAASMQALVSTVKSEDKATPPAPNGKFF